MVNGLVLLGEEPVLVVWRLWVLEERPPRAGRARFPDDLDMEKGRLLSLLPDTLLGDIS